MTATALAPDPDAATRRVLDGRLCPECLQPVRSAQWRALFCSPEHKRAWHNRATARGVSLVPLVMADRETRGGTRGDRRTGAEARLIAQRLMQDWRDQDRAAGRMSQATYMRRRLALGYVA